MAPKSGSVTFRTTLQPRGPAAAVILTDEQVMALGGGKTPPVRVTVNGKSFAGRVARMGGENMLGFNKQVRTDLDVAAGDTIDVQIVIDDVERTVDVPADLAAALDADAHVRTAFDRMAFTHRKEYVRWVEEAKRDDTRQRRVQQSVQMVREGRTRS